jgi:hypothetical protein
VWRSFAKDAQDFACGLRRPQDCSSSNPGAPAIYDSRLGFLRRARRDGHGAQFKKPSRTFHAERQHSRPAARLASKFTPLLHRASAQERNRV